MQFIWSLPFKIEIKQIMKADKKWFVYFNYPDHFDKKTALVNLDLDKM